MKRGRFLVFLALLATGAAHCLAHTFHQSHSEINHNTDEQTLEIVIQLHVDDIEAYLTLKYDRQIDLAAELEPRKLLEPYINSVFALLDESGKPLPLKWIGVEIGTHAANVYLETSADPLPAKLRNAILADYLPDQENRVTIKTDDTAPGRTVLLSRSRTELIGFFSVDPIPSAKK